MAIGDKVQIRFNSLELAQKRVMDAIRSIHWPLSRLNSEYNSSAVYVGTFRKVIESVDVNSIIINNNDKRPNIVSSFTSDYKTAYPLDTTYKFGDAAGAWRAAYQAIYTWINTNNPSYTVSKAALTQADLAGLGALLATYMATVNEAEHTW